MEKEMATHSSVLAWKIPWMEEPGSPLAFPLQRLRRSPTLGIGGRKALGTLDATHKVPRNPGLPREEH